MYRFSLDASPSGSARLSSGYLGIAAWRSRFILKGVAKESSFEKHRGTFRKMCFQCTSLVELWRLSYYCYKLTPYLIYVISTLTHNPVLSCTKDCILISIVKVIKYISENYHNYLWIVLWRTAGYYRYKNHESLCKHFVKSRPFHLYQINALYNFAVYLDNVIIWQIRMWAFVV